jgi:hypothetical protein
VEVLSMNAQPACFYRQYEGSLDSENVQLYWLKAEKSSIRYHLVFMKQPHQVYCQQLFGSQYFYPKKKSSPYPSKLRMFVKKWLTEIR